MPSMHLEGSMYLSKVEIDNNNRQKVQDLSHAGAYHHWVEQSFVNEVGGQIRSRKLWRIDKMDGKEYLLIVSQTKPDLKALEKYGVPNSGQTKDYEPFLLSLQKNMQLRFRVTLNPVVSVKVEGERGRVMPHVTVSQQMDFLLNRSEKNGFSLKSEEFTIVDRGYTIFKKTGQKPLKLSKATYEGILTVTDEELFLKTLKEGFGRKKAYGFGMMTVIPYSQ